MDAMQKADTCFQCGSKRITVRVFKEYVNNSLVTTTQSICSDSSCQKRTEDQIKRDKERRESAMLNKNFFGNTKNAEKPKK